MPTSALQRAAIVAAAATAFLPAVGHAADSSARERILFDGDWRFRQDPATLPPLQDGAAVAGWRWKAADSPASEELAATGVTTSGAGWADAAVGQDIFSGKSGFAWIRATLPDLAGPGRTLRFGGVDDNADVYVNGKKLIHHEGWNQAFDVPLDDVWNAAGPNVVAVRVENGQGAGGLSKGVSVGLAPIVAGAPTTSPSDPKFRDFNWRKVHLPHDYCVEGTFTPDGDASHGSLIPTSAWYRKTFTLPASDQGKSLWIDFDGVYRRTEVYLNGHLLGAHACGYTPFRFDLSKDAVYGGKNVISVHVDPTQAEGWWYEGAGIYRHVWLNKAAPAHVAPWGTFVASDVKDALGKPSASLTITTTVANDGAASDAVVVSSVFGPDGKQAAQTKSSVSLTAGASTDLTQTVSLASARLWSLQKPQLYRLHTEVVQGGKVIDTEDTSFGVRSIRWDAEKGFFLNEKPVKIQGVCNHQDFAGVGVAVPDTLQYWRVRKLQSMGANAWRTSHNPPNIAVLDACDKLGMLVMDENRHLGDTEDGKASMTTPYEDLAEVQTMVRRDRNHPSIILWSMCNEEGIQSTEHGAKIFSAMRDAVRKYDATRPVSCAMNGGYDSAVGITSVEDLQGINYNPSAYDWFHKAHPTLPLYGSETASQVATRGIYSWDTFKNDTGSFTGVPEKGYVSAYDVNAPNWAETAENAWKPIGERSYVAGGFVWTGFDYKGEPTPFGWPDVNSNFGVIDMAGFPKDTYWYYQSVWGDKPVTHVLPHWNWAGKEGQTVKVWAFSNADSVELFVNGQSLGKKPVPHLGHLEWDAVYAPGTLEARGYDASGKVVSSDKVETAGAPAALTLTTDRTQIAPDGEDLTVVEVRVVDDKGRVVPASDDLISFEVTGVGHIAGVGNGNPSDHDPDQAPTRHAFHGLAAVLVAAGEAKGAIHLTATAPGLKPASLDLEAK
ncbi:beta-galactosidase [Capsulimonas corticalis]|uniref:Beta-galactosidase n=1 Tax=Capsulimonas corticalis TaxID=2219043 RepID=A0A402CV60_9BACT|nr:beta-galactosidase GalA [Capsulimonas corticalis]BDI30293.1 beta-galactosidase [Capsulimonas corticalis]